MSISKAVQLIRGPKGTEVRLTISPADDRSARKVVKLIRDEIKLEDQEAKAKIIDMPGARGGTVRVGVIDLPSFYASFDPAHTRTNSEPKSTATDVSKLLKKLKEENVAGVVLDLRRNGGGSLEEAIRLTGLFIKEGPVVQIRDMDGSIEENADTDPSVVYGGPLVVLTSRFSASASEILAGALQDYGRALIVGDSSTHGKGTVQTVQPLAPYVQAAGLNLTNDPGAVKLTIKKFYRASGASTQLKGVNPDIVLPSVFNESKEIGESSFDNPMPWDTIRSAKFERMDMVSTFVPELKSLSAARIKENQDFRYIAEDIQEFKRIQADKTVSLNESERLKEKNEAKARQKAREKERLARPDPKETTYEITLKLAATPGLPPPVQKTNSVASVEKNGLPVAELEAAGDAHEAIDSSDEAEEEKPAAVDPALEEARHILVDYLGLLRRNSVAGRPSAAETAGR
jgi:carboxyl-terminal processing protease